MGFATLNGSTKIVTILLSEKCHYLAGHPIRTSASMIKADFMDKHPIRTSASMRKAHFMDKHPIRTSASMRKAHFMDGHPIRSPHRHAGMSLRYLWKGSPCRTRS